MQNELETEKTSSITKNTLYMYLRMFVMMGINLYTARVVLRVLGVEDFGIYNVVGGIVTLFFFLNGALSQATQRFIAYDIGKGNKKGMQRTFSMCLNVHLIISFIIIFLGETVGLWIVYHKLNIPGDRFTVALWAYHFSIVSSIISIVQVPFNALINAHEKFNVYAVISIFDAIVKLSLVLSIEFLEGDRLFLYALLLLIAHFIQAFLYGLYCTIYFKEGRYSLFWDKNLFRNIFGFTSWSLMGNIADTLADQGINILLNIFCGPVINAARGLAVQIKTQVSAFVTNFQSASNPQIVKRYARDETGSMTVLIMKTSKLSFFLFFIVMFPLCLEMNSILHLWLSAPPLYLREFSILTLTTVLLQSMGGTLQLAIQASGRIKEYHLTVSLVKLLCLPISYLGLYFGFSALFPFFVVMIIYGGVVYINMILVKRILGFPIGRYFKEVIIKDIEVFCVASIIPFVFVNLFKETYIRMPFTIAIALTSVGLTSFLVGLNPEERKWAVDLVKNKLKR